MVVFAAFFRLPSNVTRQICLKHLISSRLHANVFTHTLTHMSTTKPNVVFVLGPPGSGKGTQCNNIVKQFGYTHLSAGDLLREEQSIPNSQYGDVIEHHVRNGTIVPVEITCSLIEKAMERHAVKKFLIDGFPRNQNNLDGWNAQMSDKVNLEFVLFIECPEEICVERCLNRGKKGSGRSDDNMESLKKRFRTYTNDTMPIIEYYDKLGLVKKVDGSVSNPEKVFESIAVFFKTT